MQSTARGRHVLSAEIREDADMNEIYSTTEPSQTEVDRLAGPTLIEFGSPTCGHCRRAQSLLAEALAAHPGIRHIKIFDGPGRPLGRSFRVKLWPALIFMRDGEEVARLVRPDTADAIGDVLARIDTVADPAR
jgi:thioredoxin 1